MANTSVWAKPEQDAQAAQKFAMQPEPGPSVWAPVSNQPAMPDLSAFSQPAPTVQVFKPTPLQQQIGNDQQRLQHVQFQQSHPWGTKPTYDASGNMTDAGNHPGKLGKLAHVFSEIGNIAGDIFAPSTMALIPGTQLNREVQEGGRAKRLNMEQAEQAQNEHEEAETAQEQEQTREMPGEAAARERLQAAQTAEAESKVNNPDLATAYAHAVNTAIKNGVDPAQDPVVQHLSDAITSIQRQPLPKGMEKVDLVGADSKPMAANYNPVTGKYTDSAGKEIANPRPYEKPNQAGMVTVVAPDPNNPGGGIVERLGAGARIAPGSQTATQYGSMNTPTNTVRTAASRASIVVQAIPGVLADIEKNKAQMGPLMGRWNDFMQGKVGNDNPDFAALRMDLTLMGTAVALAHAQGRLPENLREEFDRAINAPHQTPENLEAAIKAVEPWMRRMQEAGERPNSAQPTSGQTIRAIDPQGKMHEAPAGTPLPKGWKLQ